MPNRLPMLLVKVRLMVLMSGLVPGVARAQWSGAPILAVGPAIPAGTFGERVREGYAVKAGLWLRAPRFPLGVTAEGMHTQFRAGEQPDGLGVVRIEALTVNATTRRHDRRLETYGVAGAGWYWMNGTASRYDVPQAPGVNAGVRF